MDLNQVSIEQKKTDTTAVADFNKDTRSTGRVQLDRTNALREFDQETYEVTTRAASSQVSSTALVSEMLASAKLLVQAREKRKAKHLLRQLLHLNPDHAEGISLLLNCLGTSESEKNLRHALLRQQAKVHPSFQSFALYAHDLLDRGQLDQALECYFQAQTLVSSEGIELFEVLKNIGNIYVKKGDFESAEESYHKAFTLNPDSDVLMVNLGTLAIQKNEWSLAQERFRRALDINSANDKAWVGLGLCTSRTGDWALSEAHLENALDLCPSNRTAVHLYANWSFSSGSFERAIYRLEDYLSTVEFDSEMSLILIHLFCQTRQFSLAKIEIERALTFDPAHEGLQEVYKGLHGT